MSKTTSNYGFSASTQKPEMKLDYCDCTIAQTSKTMKNYHDYKIARLSEKTLKYSFGRGRASVRTKMNLLFKRIEAIVREEIKLSMMHTRAGVYAPTYQRQIEDH